MAESSKQTGLCISLPLKVVAEGQGCIASDELRAIGQDFKDCLNIFHDVISKCKELNHIIIKDVKSDLDQVFLIFNIPDEDHLNKLHSIIQYEDNKLSQKITEFSMLQSWELKANLPLKTGLICSVCLPKKTFYENQVLLCERQENLNRELRTSTQTTQNDAVASSDSIRQSTLIMKTDHASTSGLTTSTQHSTHTKLPTLKKTFILYVQPLHGRKVLNVYATCKYHGFPKQDMLPLSANNNLYHVSVEICADKANLEKVIYIVVSQTITGLIGAIKHALRLKNTEYSLECIVDECTIQRDCFMSNIFPMKIHVEIFWLYQNEGLIAHIVNILSQPCQMNDIIERCMQVEKVCKIKLCDSEIILNKIKIALPKIVEVREQNLLFGVVLGNLFKDPSGVIIDKTTAEAIISNLQHFQLHYLSMSGKKYMPKVYSRLHQIARNENVSILTHLTKLYHFYGDTYILKEIRETTKTKNSKFIGSDVNTVAEDFCNKAYHSGSEDASEIISIVIRNLPLSTALHVYCILSNADNNSACHKKDIHNCIYGSIVINIETSLKNAQKNQNLQNILEMWMLVKTVTGINDKFQQKIEAAVENLLRTGSSFPENLLEIITSFIEKHGCFAECAKQKELLKIIANSENVTVNTLFIPLIQCTKICDQHVLLELDLFSEFFFSQLSTRFLKLRKEERSRIAFSILSDLWQLPFLSLHPDLEKFINKQFKEELSNNSISFLLKHTSFFENLSKKIPCIQELIDDHIRASTEQKCASRDPYQVLADSIGIANRKITVTTRIKSKLVCSLMECHGGKMLESAETFDTFFCLAQQAQFWCLIFNVEGTCTDNIKQHNVYVKARDAVKEMTNCFVDNGIIYEHIKKLENQQLSEGAKQLIVEHGIEREIVDNKWDDYHKKFAEEEETLKMIQKVISCISVKHVDEIGFHDLLERITEALKALRAGRVSLHECLQQSWLLKNMEMLPDMCQQLKPLVISKVFWNLWKISGKHLKKDLRCLNFTDEDPVSSIINLFGEMSVSDIQNNGSETSVHILGDLLADGKKLYKDAWTKLLDEANICMNDIGNMFGPNIDIQEEIKSAKAILHLDIPLSTQSALERIYSIEDVKNAVNAMESAAKAFDLQINLDASVSLAIESFKNLLRHSVDAYSFAKVKTALNTIFEIANGLSEDTINIMSNLGKSRSLIEFLKLIVDEDIRNLIDAVEDISEQQVQESTVSALIEIKSFFHPLLIANFDGKCSELFQALERQTKALKPNSSLSDKIDECIRNLHNLKSLYNNVANRSEQTKEIIQSITKKGVFHFCYDADINEVNFEVSYRQNDRKAYKQMATITDLRSRALLLMNSDRDREHGSLVKRLSQESLVKFVHYVDMCLDIKDTLHQLHSLGHPDFINVNVTKKTADLQDLNDSYFCTLSSWQDDLKFEQQTHFLMNYLFGNQIHTLYKFLDKGKEDKMTVQTLLTFIHPEINADTVKQHYLKEKQRKQHNWSNAVMLHCIGYSIHAAYEDFNVFQRHLTISESMLPRITDIVQKGKILLAQLEEGSLYTVKTVLALYSNTTQCLPEPNQLLFCTKTTSTTELALFLQRCKNSESFHRVKILYCIANIEKLPSNVQFHLVDALRNLRTRSKAFFLALVCRGAKNHPFIDDFNDCVSNVFPATDKSVQSIYKNKCPNVSFVTSNIAGLGKTSYVKKEAHVLRKQMMTLHISGRLVKETLVERLLALELTDFHVLHIDIVNVEDAAELDIFLFELIVLGFVSTRKNSVSLKTSHVYLEVANSIKEILTNSLKNAMLFNRVNIDCIDFQKFSISNEIHSAVQIVCTYLHYLENEKLDKKDLLVVKNANPLPQRLCRDLLCKCLKNKKDISFHMVNTFVNVLADQLNKMSHSPFFRIARLDDMVGNKSTLTVKSTLVKEMVNVAMEFATRSVSNCRKMQMSTVSMENSDFSDIVCVTNHTDVSEEQQTEGMIKWESSNHLMFVFHNQNIQTISAIYRNIEQVPQHIRNLFESQLKKGLQDFTIMDQHELQCILQKIARTSPFPLPDDKLQEMARAYALTPDNLLKMIIIMLRIKGNIPVIIMGETGCGKTSLIRYLATICEVQFVVMNIHAGVTEEAILMKIEECNLNAKRSCNEQWLFFDEINTSESIGLLSDIICHRMCFGRPLASNLKLLGACNPYKLRTTTSLFTAGLDGKLRTDELSRLVYRVLPLPEMMVDYVWDFGSISEKDEEIYICRMIQSVFVDENLSALFTAMLSTSQTFVRNKESIDYAVSLRDVQRCKCLAKWFENSLPNKPLLDHEAQSHGYDITLRSIVLSLAHCYHSRFSDKDARKEYRKLMTDIIISRGYGDLNEELFYHIIKDEQKDILSRMEIPEGIAQNTALQENVFVILVCIYNQIPVFVVGKPGCSKSLAMQLIRSNLRGKDSKDDFFKTLPQLYCVSFQGSESSTSDGILKVFEKAENYQRSNSKDDVLSLVILDEIGLAEVSRFNPLKVLHNLLEPDGKIRPNVAVVGISNWSLDASKMNRAIHLSRTDMDKEELFETAKSISDSLMEKPKTCTSLFNTPTAENMPTTATIEKDLHQIADSYFTYIKQLRFKHFHGLRDYYSFVKYVAVNLLRHHQYVDDESKTYIIMGGLERNFGGLPAERQTLQDVFQKVTTRENTDFKGKPHKKVIDLVAENITDPLARHLMLITTGESILGIIEKKLCEIGRERKEIIFGSQFEEDLTDDYNYRILSRIILCMEEGVVLILKDLDNIYGSLYDMLNQNYSIIGKGKKCRVALGPYSNPICHVADSFRCIVLMEENKLDKSDPPFLNRFEKQNLGFMDTVDKVMLDVIMSLKHWLKELASMPAHSFLDTDLFPIYHSDLIASLVIKLDNNISHCQFLDEKEVLLEKCKSELLWIAKPEAIVRLSKATEHVLQCELEKIRKQYFSLPLHNGLEHLMAYQNEHDRDHSLTIVFTNSNVHKNFLKQNDTNVQIEKLSIFKSEKQLSGRICYFWQGSHSQILIIQCNAVDDAKHLMLTKSLVEKYRNEYITKSPMYSKSVYLIIHLDKTKNTCTTVSQLNFLSEWKLVMLDSLECPKQSLEALCNMTFLETVRTMRPLRQYLQSEIFWAFTRIRYGSCGRSIKSITDIVEHVEQSPEFAEVLEEEILNWIHKNITNDLDKDWQANVACDMTALSTSSTFLEALEQHILNSIKIPLSKIISEIETTGILDSFFIDDNCTTERRSVWISKLQNIHLFSTEHIPDSIGPECYSCDTPDFALKMPFSRLLYNIVETTKDDFLETLNTLSVNCRLDNKDVFPIELFEEASSQHEEFILQKIPDLLSFTYASWKMDYIDDFCNMFSWTICPTIPHERRIKIMKWLVTHKIDLQSDDPFQLIIYLHTTCWAHSHIFINEMQMLHMCWEFDEGIDHIFKNILECVDMQHKGDSLPEENGFVHVPQTIDNDIISQSNLLSELKPEENKWFTGISGNVTNDEGNCQNVISFDSLFSSSETETSFSDKDICVKTVNLLHNDARDIETNENTSLCDVSIYNDSQNILEESVSPSDNNNMFVNSDISMQEQLQILQMQTKESLAKRGSWSNEMADKDIIGADNVATATIQMDSSFSANEHIIENDTLSCLNNTMKALESSAVSKHSTLTVDLLKPGELEYVSKGLSSQHTMFKQLLKNVKTNMSIEDAIVFVVCQSMLPNQETLDQAQGIHYWERKIYSILNFAFQVSRETQLLFALRMCCEIAGSLIIPLGLNENILSSIGDLLQQGYQIDSPEIYEFILELLEAAKCNKTSNLDVLSICQKLFSSYIFRCISANPETNAFEFLLTMVENSELFSSNLHTLKAPLLLLLQSEEETVFLQILEDEHSYIDDVLNENIYLSCLNTSLENFYHKGKCNDSFVLLLIDILQDIFENLLEAEDSEQLLQHFYQSHRIMTKNNFGFQYVLAIAYFKACIPNLVKTLNVGNIEQRKQVMDALEIVLCKYSDSDVTSQLVLYFFKILSSSYSFGRLCKYCASEEHAKRFPSIIKWTETYANKCLESCSLCLHVSGNDHINYNLCSLLDTDDFLSLKKNINSLMEGSLTDRNKYICLITFAIKQFYYPKTYTSLNDTTHSLMKIFVNESKTFVHMTTQIGLLECVTGERDFLVPEFNIGETVSHDHCCKVTFLVAAFTLLLSNTNVEQNQTSVLMKCLTTPLDIVDMFLPGFDENNSDIFNCTHESYHMLLSSCKCGHRISQHDSESDQLCVICMRKLIVEQDNTTGNCSIMPKPGFVLSNGTSAPKSFTRKLNPVALQVLQLLIKGCLLGSLAIGITAAKVLEEITGIPEINIASYLWMHISIHWENISKLVNVDGTSQGILLQSVLFNTFEHVFLNSCQLRTHDQRQMWEIEFQKLLDTVINERFTITQGLINQHDKLHGFADGIIEHRLLEVDNISLLNQETRTATMPLLFRINVHPSKDNFMLELHTRRTDFPFLSLVIQNEDDLNLPHHIFNILQWHNVTVANCSYLMKKQECLKMTVEDFLHSKTTVIKKDVMKTICDHFKKTWEYLKKAWKCQEFGKRMTNIHGESKMFDLLILNKTSLVYQVLEALIMIQNNFLDKTLAMVPTCEAVHFLSRGKGAAAIQSINITRVKKEHLIAFAIDWNALLLEESQGELTYGCGKKIHYDFMNIQKIMAVKLLSGKGFLEYENFLPHITFLDEIYMNYSTMVEEVRKNIRQEGLLPEIINGINSKKAEDPRMATDLLNHVGIVMTLLKRTKGDPEQPLVDYVGKWKNILNREFPRHLLPHPESNVKLCHIVALSELLEELCSESITDGLPQEFREELDCVIQDQLLEISKVDKLLPILIKALKRFTYRCLQSNTATVSGQSLRSYLSDVSFWPEDTMVEDCIVIDCKQYRLSEMFPDGLMVRHIFACVTLLETELEKKQQKNLKMDKFATSFQAIARNNPETRFSKMKRKVNAFNRNY